MGLSTRRGPWARIAAALTGFVLVLGAVAAAAPASAAAGTSRLNRGERLSAGQSLVSPSGSLTLVMQGDGNLVLYAPGGIARWDSHTNNHPGAFVQLQGDGNLVLYGADLAVLKNWGTNGTDASFLQVQDDGNLVLYTSANTPLWNSETHYFPARINAPGTLSLNSGLQSPSGRYDLVMQTDGNLVFRKDGVIQWHTNTGGVGVTRLSVQADGNLVLYTGSGYAWAANSGGKSGGFFQVQDDGNVVFYTASASPIWDSNSATNLIRAGQTPPKADCSTVTAPVATGSTTVVGGIRVNTCLSSSLTSLLTDAKAAGISLGGWGWRSYDSQVALRKQNCGTTHYAIYEMPSSKCSPPTAIPGSSRHERGTAIDFTVGGATLTTGSAGYKWLQTNASRYGLYNLASEPWHWSVDGH